MQTDLINQKPLRHYFNILFMDNRRTSLNSKSSSSLILAYYLIWRFFYTYSEFWLLF